MLFSRGFLILFLFSTVLQSTYTRSHRYKREPQSSKDDFDILLFTQRWPTVCFELKKHGLLPNCRLPRSSHEEWTIHGIWPTQYHKIDPSYCNSTRQFNESALSPIIDTLDEQWPDMTDNTPHFSFWQCEWEKHGTCSSNIGELNTELKYFQKGLDLLDEYDMTRVLANASILPGHHYAVEEITNGVQRILGKTIEVICIQNPTTNESYLVEIRICLDKSLKLADCNGTFHFPTNCDPNIPVKYTQVPHPPNIRSHNN